jgi:CP family cyanate transporter-like MFS transporter
LSAAATEEDRSAWSGALAARRVVALVAVAVNLRIALVVVGPVIERIRADTGMSSPVAGLLNTIPFLCMSVFAFAGAPMLRRLGLRDLIVASMALIGCGAVIRSAAHEPALMLAGTLPIGIGIGMIGVALPALVKRHFSARGSAMTGVYIAAMCLSAAVASLAVAPVAAWWGWRFALAVLTVVPMLLGAGFWLAGQIDRRRTPAAAGNPLLARPTRPALALALIFGFQSFCFGALLTWLAALYQSEGWSLGGGALLNALMMALVVPAALIVPRLSEGHDRRPWLAGSSATMAAGILGLALAPAAAPVLWIVLVSSGSGGLFSLTISMPLDLHETPADVADLVTWILGIGFLLTAAGPVVTGAIRDHAGGFPVAMLVLAAVASVPGVLAYAALPRG